MHTYLNIYNILVGDGGPLSRIPTIGVETISVEYGRSQMTGKALHTALVTLCLGRKLHVQEKKVAKICQKILIGTKSYLQ